MPRIALERPARPNSPRAAKLQGKTWPQPRTLEKCCPREGSANKGCPLGAGVHNLSEYPNSHKRRNLAHEAQRSRTRVAASWTAPALYRTSLLLRSALSQTDRTEVMRTHRHTQTHRIERQRSSTRMGRGSMLTAVSRASHAPMFHKPLCLPRNPPNPARPTSPPDVHAYKICRPSVPPLSHGPIL